MEIAKNKWVNLLILFFVIVFAVMIALLCSHWVKDSSGNSRLSPFGLGAAKTA